MHSPVAGTFSFNSMTFSDRCPDSREGSSAGPNVPQAQYLAMLLSLAPNRRNTSTMAGGGSIGFPQNGCSSKYWLMATMVRLGAVHAEGRGACVCTAKASAGTGTGTGSHVGCCLDILEKASSSTLRARSIAAAVIAWFRA